MPGRTETALFESGRATAPPGVRYTSLTGSTSEGYTHTVAATSATTNLADQIRTTPVQSPRYTPNYSNYLQQRPQASPRYTPTYSPCPSPSPNYPVGAPKPTPSPSSSSSSLPSQSPQYTPNYSSASHLYSPSFNTSTNFSNFSNTSNFDQASTSTVPAKPQGYTTHENSIFPSSEQLSTALFNIPKTSKPNTTTSPRYTPNYSNFSYFSNSNNQTKAATQNNIDTNVKGKNELFEVPQKVQKATKEEAEFNYNIGDLQQFLTKHSSKIKGSEAATESVTDSLLNYLQRKTLEKNVTDNNLPFESVDSNQVVVSICSKNKGDEGDGLMKKKEENPKLMNNFLSKVISEKEEKRFKGLDDKKKNYRKDLDELNLEIDEKKNQRDAMSHFQEDKTHHKRSSNFGDFNQWDYLNPQDVQTGNNHNRRGHLPYCGTSQSRGMSWNPMGMGMAHQTNPYYSNPHGHVMPAHAHTEYRYNQWNNPNHKNVTNIQNAHSQNSTLPQSKLDMKLHNVPQNKALNAAAQEFALPINSPTEFSKLRSSPHDMVHRTPPPDLSHQGKSTHSEYPPSISPALRNPPPLRTPPPIPGHPKAIISNPLSDLQMLVTNQETDNVPQKNAECYQQESVDLSAHSDSSRLKENTIDKLKDKCASERILDKNESRSPVSVIQKQTASISDDITEKPVELTAKREHSVEKEITSTNNDTNSKDSSSAKVEGNVGSQKGEHEDGEETSEHSKPSVIVEKEITMDKSEETGKRGSGKSEEEDDIAKELALLDCPGKKQDEKAVVEEALETKKEDSPTNNEPVNETNTDNPGKRKAESDGNEPDAKKVFIEVESELEKMFEGVNEVNLPEEQNDLPTVSSTSTDVKPTISESGKKAPRKKPSRTKRAARLSSGQSSGSENHHKKNFKNPKDVKKLKKGLCEVDSSKKGPFLHIEGTRDCPSSVAVVNFPKGDDEDEKDKSLAKKQSSVGIRSKSHHNELDYRGKSRNGLFSSTLSARYDAHTTDQTWICVFCKKGPHYCSLGDLFGPYIIYKDETSTLCDFSGDEKDISDAQKRGGRNKKSIRSNNMVEHFQKMSRKLRRAQSTEFCLTGMNIVSDDQDDDVRYEVWVHEQCAVWSPNVCLIGSKIVGMQEAIWSSVRTMCSKCGNMGANLGCVHRNCPNRSHYHCAQESGWSLEQQTFISTCQVHKPRS